MESREGVIKYRLEFVRNACILPEMVGELIRWRHIHYRLQLIGRSSDRYDGYGYGNISRRCPSAPPGSFIVSGTQTGAIALLGADDFSLVTGCFPGSNRIIAEGLAQPSSEAMTHGQLYQLDPSIQCVVHVHSPEIWHAAVAMNLPQTAEDIVYGTPAMAAAVEELFRKTIVGEKKLFVMKGHQDGVVSFGNSIAEASQVIIAALADSPPR